jgi:hypothetical protein
MVRVVVRVASRRCETTLHPFQRTEEPMKLLSTAKDSKKLTIKRVRGGVPVRTSVKAGYLKIKID